MPAKRTRPKVLVADQRSRCFDDVRWTSRDGGVAFVQFHKDGSQYSYNMSRAEFKEWRDDESLGAFFNLFVR